MQMQYFLANIIVIGLSIAFLAHFGLIVYHRQVVISEPHPVILILEIKALIGLIVFCFSQSSEASPLVGLNGPYRLTPLPHQYSES